MAFDELRRMQAKLRLQFWREAADALEKLAAEKTGEERERLIELAKQNRHFADREARASVLSQQGANLEKDVSMHRDSQEILKQLAELRGDSNYQVRQRVDNMVRDMAQELLRLPDGPEGRAALTSIELRHQQLALFAAQNDLGYETDDLIKQLGREIARVRAGGDPHRPLG
jgi:hypothetical protein